MTGVIERGKKRVFKLARCIPSIRDKINKELADISQTFEKDTLRRLNNLPFVLSLPKEGLSNEEILNKVKENVYLGKINFNMNMCFNKYCHIL